MKLPFPQNVGRPRTFRGHTLPTIFGESVPAANRVREAIDRWGEARPTMLVSRAICTKRATSGLVIPSANGFLRSRLAQRFVY
jgi:hypothetical protein